MDSPAGGAAEPVVRVLREELLREDGRHHRQTLIPWWDQRRVAAARVLVIGAGALGNEVCKLLALLGVGRVIVVDMDRVENSNLSRTVLFGPADIGALKAERAAARMSEIDPAVTAVGLPADVVHQAGLGLFLWADVVIGGVDNREARVAVNAACARAGRAWVDGAIEALSGVVRVFDPALGPCYECTMNATDRRLLAERRSCAMLARRAVAGGHVPATATTASIVAGLQVQEAVKMLHGQPVLLGEGLHIDGWGGDVHRVRYQVRPDCLGHDRLPRIEPLGLGSRDISLRELVLRAEAALGPGAFIETGRDLVTSLACPTCGREDPAGRPLGAVLEAEAACPACGTHRIPDFRSVFDRDSGAALDRTPAEAGVPPFDVLVARRGLDERVGWLLDGDAAEVLGPLADTLELAGRKVR